MRHLEIFVDLKCYMDNENISTIHDISSWHSNGRWVGWKNLETLESLRLDYAMLQTILQGPAPIHISLSDSRSWGKYGNYTVKDGYNSIHNNSRKEVFWENVWSKDDLPKINYFYWILAHHKILTAKNLKKRGIEGLSHCILCKNSEETLEYLFSGMFLC